MVVSALWVIGPTAVSRYETTEASNTSAHPSARWAAPNVPGGVNRPATNAKGMADADNVNISAKITARVRALHDSRVAQIPAGRPGTPEEVAAAVSYLAAPDAGWTTGQILQVNGGTLLGRG